MNSFFQRTVFGPNYRWWALSIVSLAVFASTTDHGLVSISLPTIMDYFKADMSFAGWIILIHSLVTGCLFIPLGRLSDLIGHKRIMSAGFLLYGIGSAVAGLSQTPTQLMAFRILQCPNIVKIKGHL
jgi:MFS family permease